MRIEDAAAITYAGITRSIHDDIYSTQPQPAECPICSEEHCETSDIWMIPHECAHAMSSDLQYVCCEDCAEKWRVIYFEEIEEFEEK